MTTIAFRAAGSRWVNAYRAANLLAREGLSPVLAAKGFAGTTPSGGSESFEAGTIVVEGDLDAEALVSRFGVEAVALGSTKDVAGLPVRPVRIAVYGGGGAPYNHAAAYGELGFLVDFVFPEDILAGALAYYDLLAVPGGGGRAMMGQLDPLGQAGTTAIADFVREGGLYLGCCAGAYDASIVAPSFLQVCPQQQSMQMINAAVWNSGDEWLGLQSPGVGVLRAEIAAEHPVTYGMPKELAVTHYNGPLYQLQPGTISGASDAVGLMRVAGTEGAFTPAERFLDGDADDDELLINRAVSFGAFNAVAGSFGDGRVVLFGSHPEMGLSLDLDQWDAPTRMLANAAFWQGSAGDGRRRVQADGHLAQSPEAAKAGLTAAQARIDAVVAKAEALRARDASGAAWLEDKLAMSTFGASAEEIWERNLAGFATAAEGMKGLIAEIEGKLERARARLRGAEAAELASAIGSLDRAVNDRTPEAWNIDFGYEGLLQHLERAERMLGKAEANFGASFAPDPNPYAYFDESPFQLAVGSYLSAAGVFANCALLLRLENKRLENALLLTPQQPPALV
jgi:hypothetical protein